MADDVAIRVSGLWEGYHRKSQRGWRKGEIRWALQDVGFTVERGEVLGVVGSNGSGKSTLLLCVAGVLRPQRGEIHTRGRVASLVELRAGMNRELTGRENVLTAGVLGGMTRAEVRRKYDDIVAFAELDEKTMNAPLRTYSQGMGLRVGFSVTVLSDPDVLLVDEVLAVGDEGFQQKCLDKVNELCRGGTGVLLVSHDLDLIAKECDRVAVLDGGRIVHLSAPAEAVAFYRELKRARPDDDSDDLGRHARMPGRRARHRI